MDIASWNSLDFDLKCIAWSMKKTWYTMLPRVFLVLWWSMVREQVWRTSIYTNVYWKQRIRTMLWLMAHSNASTIRSLKLAQWNKRRHWWHAQATNVGSVTTTFTHWHSVITNCRKCKDEACPKTRKLIECISRENIGRLCLPTIVNNCQQLPIHTNLTDAFRTRWQPVDSCQLPIVVSVWRYKAWNSAPGRWWSMVNRDDKEIHCMSCWSQQPTRGLQLSSWPKSVKKTVIGIHAFCIIYILLKLIKPFNNYIHHSFLFWIEHLWSLLLIL